MHYEINVSHNGKHFFATADRSIILRSQLEAILRKFIEAFPRTEGYQIRVTYWETSGKDVTFDATMSQNSCVALHLNDE